MKSARRVLDVLELLATSPDGATFAEIGQRLSLPKSSLHALLATLAERGWVEINSESRRYRVGVRAWQAGQGYARANSLASAAAPHMVAARDELNETIQLAILDGIQNVYIAKVEAEHPLRLVSDVGTRLPAYATGLGKVLLASLPVEELRARFAGVHLQQFTDHTVKTVDDLERMLADVRESGLGEDDGEYTSGVFCVAAPIRDNRGAVVAAMSCSVPHVRLAPGDGSVERLRQVVAAHARNISRALGWIPAEGLDVEGRRIRSHRSSQRRAGRSA